MSAAQRLAAVSAAFVMLAAAACSSLAPWTGPAPVPPEDWHVVSVFDVDGALTASVALPLSIRPADHPPAGLDNRVDAVTREGLTVQFEGPRNPDSQPLPGEDLRALLDRRLALEGAGEATYTDVRLPVGPAARMDRLDDRGGWTFRVVCYAITMRDGVAFLMFDGGPETFAGHELEISHIAMFIRQR
jgi:hypothetical protein